MLCEGPGRLHKGGVPLLLMDIPQHHGLVLGLWCEVEVQRD